MSDAGFTFAKHDGADVLPWFKPESAGTALPAGTRLYSFSDYHQAPEGTKIRLGRKGGKGDVLAKRGSAFWYVDDDALPGITAYGLENRPSYVE